MEDVIRRVAIYLRVSTKEQAEKGWSIEGQYNDIRRYCEGQPNIQVVRIYKDNGHSGSTLERPAMQNLLIHAQQKKFDIIVCWKYDRLSRDNSDFPTLLSYLKSYGIDAKSVTEPTPPYDSPYGEFVVGMIGLVSTLERKVFAMRSKMGMKTRVKKGLWKGGATPFGYTYNKNTGKLVINKNEVKIVRKIFDKYLKYQTLSMVRHYLTSNDIPTRSGKPWAVPVISRMLANKCYIGYILFNDLEIPDSSLKIIDKKQFDKVQKLKEERRQFSPDPHGFYAEMRKQQPALSYNDMPEDSLVREYLQKKASMPTCPRCKNSMGVINSGKHHYKKAGVQQQYYCKIANTNLLFIQKNLCLTAPVVIKIKASNVMEKLKTRKANFNNLNVIYVGAISSSF